MPKNPKDSTGPTGQRPLAGSERPPSKEARLLGALDPNEPVAATIVVRRPPDAPPLPSHEELQRVQPGHPHHLSMDEYTQRYGATREDLDAVVNYVQQHGITVLESHAGRRTVTVQGTAAQMAAVFGVRLNRYESPLPHSSRHMRASQEQAHAPAKHIHHGFKGAVHLPPELQGLVLAVVGLDDRPLAIPGGGTGDPPGAVALQVPAVATFYNFPNTGAADQVIGVISPQSTPGSGGSYLATDINNNYFPNLTNAAFRTPPRSINDVNLTVGAQTFSNNAGAVRAITAAGLNATAVQPILEVTQDISTAATIAQGATINVYFTQSSEQGWLVFLNRVLFPQGELQPTVVSCSFFLYPGDDSSFIGSLSDSGSVASVMTGLFQQLAVVGINVFIAQGDWGAGDWSALTATPPTPPDGKTHVQYPGSDPWVTSCGGTVLAANAAPPPSFTEWVWSDAFSGSTFGNPNSNLGATGGGVSATFPAPFYQTAAGITGATDSAGNVLSGRGVPDVAGMVGLTGFFVNGIPYSFTGTSCVAPFYAGLAAVLRSAFGVSLGFFNSLIYKLGGAVTNDVTNGNNDSNTTPANVKKAIPTFTGTTPDAPFFTSGPGWDACTGWGSIDGAKLLSGIAGLLYNQLFYFGVEKNTYGLNEVQVNSIYPAFRLTLDGFAPNAVVGRPTLSGAFAAVPGVTIQIGAALPELPSRPGTPQRILFSGIIEFAPSAISSVPNGGIFPAVGAGEITLPLTASATVNGQLFQAVTLFNLVPGADPFFANFNQNFYLSQDLRVFTVTPGLNNAPLAGLVLAAADNINFDTNAAYQYIQTLIALLNKNNSVAGGPDPFPLLPNQANALTADSSVSPYSIDPANPNGARFANYNFALARVRLTGQANSSTVKPVRVFFRLFVTQTPNTDYDPLGAYFSSPDSAGFPASPLIGVGDVSIPFFATGNYETNDDYRANLDYMPTGGVNSQPIQAGPSGKVWVYYGCYLNLYRIDNTIAGKPVQGMLPGTHHCLVAQIAYDDAPIGTAPGIPVNPANSDKLAQRNLEITYSDNPGPASTHRIPQTFDLRPGVTPAAAPPGDLLGYPDELMIEWGNTPAGTTAHVYWPQVKATDVLSLAKTIYATHQLSAADANTVRCTVPQGFTFVPIPPGAGENFAGLITLDLPPTVVTGQVFNITLRRLTTRQGKIPTPPPPSPPRIAGAPGPAGAGLAGAGAASAVGDSGMFSWRAVTGTFAIRIPVSTAKHMLPLEEDTLAIMKWRLAQWPPADRWYPVLVRYIEYISKRVDGLGGNATAIPPSPWGAKPPIETGRRCEEHPKRHQHTGKVSGLVYDRFGDFEGFTLDTEDGDRLYASREREIASLAERAWRERLRITVVSDDCDPERPVTIIVRHPPVPFAN